MRAVVASLALALFAPALAAADPCEERGKQLTAWLDPLHARQWFRAPFRLQPGQTLVTAHVGLATNVTAYPESGHLVELTATETRLAGELTSDAALTAKLRAAFEASARLTALTASPAFGDAPDIVGGLTGPEGAPPPAPPRPGPAAPPAKRAPQRVLLAVAPDVPFARVAAAVRAARTAGAAEIGFAFAAGGLDVTPPGPSPIDARLQQIGADTDPARKATALRTLLDQVVATCPDARHLAHAGDRFAIVNASVFLTRCKCAVDVPSLRAFAWAMSYVDAPIMTVYAPMSGRRTTKLALAGKTPWSVASRKVLAAVAKGRPVALVQR